MLTRNQARRSREMKSDEDNTVEKHATKRTAGSPHEMAPTRKRSVLGDLTNDLRKVHIDSSKKTKIFIGKSTTSTRVYKPQQANSKKPSSPGAKCNKSSVIRSASETMIVDETALPVVDEETVEIHSDISIYQHRKHAHELPDLRSAVSTTDVANMDEDMAPSLPLEDESIALKNTNSQSSLDISNGSVNTAVSQGSRSSSDSDSGRRSRQRKQQNDDNCSAVPGITNQTSKNDSAAKENAAEDAAKDYDYDNENIMDPFNVPHYAQDIFAYYAAREPFFRVGNYLERQGKEGVTRQMRAVLVDWMVEIQENFELNHETLYQAVKMLDLYLDKTVLHRSLLQLVGTAALFIACKFDERLPPLSDDFLYICDDAYSRKQFFDMEQRLLKTLGFDIGFPLSYRFLRRYAKTTKTKIQTLTLARYILETSLLEYDFSMYLDSQLAAASLLLALRMTKDGDWTTVHQKYSGYTVGDTEPLMWKLNKLMKGTPLTKNLLNIETKYSHEIFFSVAKIPPLPDSSDAPTTSPFL